jgi:phosphate starvation-inducible PhoH-like protein
MARKKSTRSKNVTNNLVIDSNLLLEDFDDNNNGNGKFRSLDDIEFRTDRQQDFWNLIYEKEITLCSGPAGTGKSYISLARALQIFSRERKKYRRIIVVKPVVEADEKLGYLPGTVEEKLEPYVYSTKYILEKILGKQRVDSLFSKGKLEVMALAYMRGINIDNAIVVCEEAQNMTPKQMKTLLTRIGEDSKFIVSGDHEQSDRYRKPTESGLYFAMNKLKNIQEIGILEFEQSDIVRNPVISKILERFNGDIDID